MRGLFRAGSIDPDRAQVQCLTVTDPDDVPADAVPFEMPGVELGHHGS